MNNFIELKHYPEFTVKGNRWLFPEKITFEAVSDYTKIFDNQKNLTKIIFDLQNTQTVHTAFLGFLINSKNCAEKDNILLELDLSTTLNSTLEKLKLKDYLLSSSAIKIKKSA